ncbi:MAG: iron ABC transporter permease [Oscillospiraceae bacterium]|jgi:iron complex transport system permease protein|nr:iron ABC transporter permease [Oscillospiraceae bacterium]
MAAMMAADARAADWTRGRRDRRRRFALATAALGALAFLLCCAMLLMGNTLYPVGTVWNALRGVGEKGVLFAARTIRLPRMLAGLFAGFAFGMAGSVFQTLLRNPLANPNIIGITSGSSAGAVYCILTLHAGAGAAYASSIAGGMATTLAMFILSNYRKRFSASRMILVGIGIQAMCNALVSYMLIAARERDVPAATRWLSGSLNGVRLPELYPLFAASVVVIPVALLFSGQLRMLELGEDAALTLGVRAGRTRAVLMACAVVLAATATAATGPIAFVSFLSGPIAKRLAGNGNSHPLPAGLFGAALTLASDLAGQFAFEQRFPVGVVTGILGAPYLIFLLVRMSGKGEL